MTKGVRPNIGKGRATLESPMVWQVAAKRAGISELGFETMMVHYFGNGWMRMTPTEMIPELQKLGIWKEAVSLMEGLQMLWWTYNEEKKSGTEQEETDLG